MSTHSLISFAYSANVLQFQRNVLAHLAKREFFTFKIRCEKQKKNEEKRFRTQNNWFLSHSLCRFALGLCVCVCVSLVTHKYIHTLVNSFLPQVLHISFFYLHTRHNRRLFFTERIICDDVPFFCSFLQSQWMISFFEQIFLCTHSFLLNEF